MTDVYTRYRARRNNGIFEPEYRLHFLIVPAICVPIGLLMFGFGAQREMHWAILFVGVGFINVGLTGVANIGMTYVMDSYFPVAADALLVVNGLKNVVGFGFSYGVVPWITESGYQKVNSVSNHSISSLCGNVLTRHLQVFGAMTGIFLGILALAIPLCIFGRATRHYTSSQWKIIWW